MLEEYLNEKKLADKVFKIVKLKKIIVREIVDEKKSIIVFGIKERREPSETVRDYELKDEINKVLDMMKDESGDLKEEIEVYRVASTKIIVISL